MRPHAEGDPREIVKAIDVPVISVVAQGDVLDTLPNRRPDSDDRKSRFRMYEIAGASHANRLSYDTCPIAEQNAATKAQGGVDWPFDFKCVPDIPFSTHPLLSYSFDAALHNLEGRLFQPQESHRAHRSRS